MIQELLNNKMLISALLAWSLGQAVKIPVHYLIHRKWDWSLLFTTGGMPSTHSAMMSAVTLSIGLHAGFNTAAFAIAFTITMIVVYDAAGVRRQAGLHAEKINQLITEIFTSHPISEGTLKEVIGHSPPQVIVGIIFGITISLLLWVSW